MDPNRFQSHGKSVSFDLQNSEIKIWFLIRLLFWFTGGTDDFNRSHVILKPDEDDIEDAILIIEHAELTDRESYNCTATNPATDFNSTVFKPATDGAYVRVKGMSTRSFIEIPRR